MSDHFQSVVFPDVALEVAPTLGAELVAWLQQQNIIAKSLSDCALGLGYAPSGAYAQVALDPQDTALPRLMDLVTNGVELITERTVFHAGEFGFASICPHCQVRCEGFDVTGDAIDAWHRGDTAKPVICPVCQHRDDLLRWHFDPVYGFGSLGLTFWNWPELATSFLDQLSVVTTQRCILVTGML